MNDGATDDLQKLDCGHTVPKNRVVSKREVIICDECYTPFSVTDWPQTIGEKRTRVRERRSTSVEITKTFLLGLDRRGRAVYYDSENNRIRTFVPKHDRAYQQDRHERQQEEDKPRLRSRRHYVSPEGPVAPRRGEFVTLKNGDHIVEVETSEKLDTTSLGEWLSEHSVGWQQVHPKIVKRHEIEGYGAESGKPVRDYECRDCGHIEEDTDPEANHLCPECESYSYHPRPED